MKLERRLAFSLLILLLVGPLSTAATALPSTDPWPTERIPVLILSGGGEHDWQWTSTYLREFLEESGKFDVEVSIFPEAALLDPLLSSRYRVIVLDYHGSRLPDRAEKAFFEAIRTGTGAVGFHSVAGSFEGWKEYDGVIGQLFTEQTRHSDFHSFDVQFARVEHPLVDGLENFKAHPDVLMGNLADPSKLGLDVLATAYSDTMQGGTGRKEPLLFAGTHEKGRFAYTTLGNVTYDQRTWTSFRDPQFQELVIRCVEWAATGEVTPLRMMEPNTLTPGDRAAGWKLLFDGKSSGGWRSAAKKGMPEDKWQVENGCLKIQADAGSILSSQRYENFELELDWRTARGSDIGLFYGLSPDGNGYVWKNAEDVKKEDGSTGPPPGMERAEGHILRPAGAFNHVRVVARDFTVEHWLNGIKIATFYMTPGEWAQKSTLR